MPFAGTVAPQGCLLCDGSAVSRTTYADLFSVIGTIYGAGDGSTTFNIPDLSGKVVLGVSNSHSLGSTGGSETVTLTSDQLPSHVHVVPQHGHGNNIAARTQELRHSITQQPIVKYYQSSKYSNLGGGSIDSVPKDVEQITISSNSTVSDHPSESCTVGGSVGACSEFNSGTYGNGVAHNNMQPYMAINYIIVTGV